jgi:hypothetical protein
MSINHSPVMSRRQLIKVMGAGAALTALPVVLTRTGYAQQQGATQIDCESIWKGFDIMRQIFKDIADTVGGIIGGAAKGPGIGTAESALEQAIKLNKQMATATGIGVVKGAIAEGVVGQRSYLLDLQKRLGEKGATAKLDWANEQIAKGNHQAVADDPDFAPVVKTVLQSVQQFSSSLRDASNAMQKLELANVDQFAKDLSQARQKKEVSDEELARLRKLYADHPGLVEAIDRTIKTPLGRFVPAGEPFSPRLAATGSMECSPCAVAPAGDAPISERLLALLGIRSAHAVEPITLILGTALIVMVVLVVAAVLTYAATLWTYIKCVQTTQEPSRFDDCVANAQRNFDEAVQRARRNRTDCVAYCSNNFCVPFWCEGAEAAELTAANAVLMAALALCYLIT